MKKQVFLSVFIFTVFVSAIISLESCKKELTNPVIDATHSIVDSAITYLDIRHKDTIDSIIGASKQLTPMNPVQLTQVGPPRDSISPDNKYQCKVISYRWGAGSPDFLFNNPSSDVIYLGSLIRAEGIASGSYPPITVPRNPLKFSISLPNIIGSPSGIIDDPSTLSSYREAMFQLLKQGVKGTISAATARDEKRIYSESQANVYVGATFNGYGVDASGSFDWTKNNIHYRHIFKYYQNFYSVNIDLPKKPSDLIKGIPNLSLLNSYSPVYVSNIVYGRVVFMTIESEKEESEIKAALNVAYDGLVAGGSLDIKTAFKNLMRSSTLKVFAYGGNSEGAASINSPESLEEYIKKGANFSENSIPQPMSYTLRFLKNNEIYKIVQMSEYNVAECSEIQFRTYEVGTAGGGGGDPFDFQLPENAKFLSVQVNAGEYVDGLTFRYLTSSGEIKSEHHGGDGGRFFPTISLDNVRIIGISGRFGDKIDKLRFHYSDGTTSEDFGGGGGDKDFSFQVTKKTDEITGFFGRSGRLIDAIAIRCKGR